MGWLIGCLDEQLLVGHLGPSVSAVCFYVCLTGLVVGRLAYRVADLIGCLDDLIV